MNNLLGMSKQKNIYFQYKMMIKWKYRMQKRKLINNHLMIIYKMMQFLSSINQEMTDIHMNIIIQKLKLISIAKQ
jgi:hypothetical protein